NFDGDRDKAEHFLITCKAYLDLNDQTYTMDKSKIIFVTSFMNNRNTGSWAQGFLKTLQILSPYTLAIILSYGMWANFLKEFNDNFKAVDPEGTAMAKLCKLKQSR
ncbi:hypothetical protein BDR07DRAFT_1251697, partial [Suillus spraguei]